MQTKEGGGASIRVGPGVPCWRMHTVPPAHRQPASALLDAGGGGRAGGVVAGGMSRSGRLVDAWLGGDTSGLRWTGGAAPVVHAMPKSSATAARSPGGIFSCREAAG